MTTEIAILNRSAVALAADSAATITRLSNGGRRIAKIYTSANKLFELVKGCPVGIMIYDGSEIAGVPWETLVKSFRQSERHCKHDCLEGYATDFLEYCRTALSAGLSSEDLERTLFAQVLTAAAGMLADAEEGVARISSKRQRKSVLEASLDQWLSDFPTQNPVNHWADPLLEKAQFNRLCTKIQGAIPADWANSKLTNGQRRKIAESALQFLFRTNAFPGPNSGIVIAGFGESELFPSMYHSNIGGILDGRLMELPEGLTAIDPRRPSEIIPFAQKNDALTFLMGIDPAVSGGITSFWNGWSETVHDGIAEIVSTTATVAPADLATIKDQVRVFMDEAWREFSDFMVANFHNPRANPIAESAAFLSKGEIADLAENLVELTSLRNRVSLDRQETVGGATDVAVISKGDGFVWVKRKHYFDADRNPTWGMRQTLSDVLSGREDRKGAPSQ